MERREMRCDFDKDVCHFGYPLNRAIDGKKSTTLDGENSTAKRQRKS
jgi:hypothetical protein